MGNFSCVGVPGLQFFGRPGTFLGFFVPGLHFFGRPGTLGEGKMWRGRDSVAQDGIPLPSVALSLGGAAFKGLKGLAHAMRRAFSVNGGAKLA